MIESFSTEIFPDQLKIAKVITLHKRESAENPSNYRPISLLFSVKFVKKNMRKRLYNFLEMNNVLHSLQFGFRKKHSTSHTLIRMTEETEIQLIMENMGVVFSLTSKKLWILSITPFF